MAKTVLLACILTSALTLSSCKSLETKEGIGQIVGGVLGAAVGDKLGKNSKHRERIAIFSTLAGAYIGGKIGEKLDEEDKQRMNLAAQKAVASGNTTTWSNPKNKTSGELKVVSSTTKPKPIKVKVLKSKVKQVPPLEIIGGTYLANTVTNVRGGPSTEFVVVGKLDEAQAVRVIGQVKGKSWYMISEGGAGSGFVYKNLLEEAPTATVDDSEKVDADDIVEEQVASKTLCREIQNTATLSDGSKVTEKLTACQGPNGWEIKPAVA